MKFTRRMVLGAATVLVAASAYGGAANAQDKKVAIVLPGSITDQAFNQVLYEGIVLVGKETGMETAYSEKVKQADQSEHLEDYARRGYGLVYGAGGEFVDSTKRAARRYPETLFACLNCSAVEGVATIGYDNVSIGYLLGFTAGKMVETGKIGIVAGQKIAPVLQLVEGMTAGMKDAMGGGEVLVTYTEDWDDVAKAKEATFGQISQGAQAIIPYLDNGIVGVMQALEEKGMWGLGAITDLGSSWPKTNLISAVQDWRQAILFYANEYENGTAEKKVYTFGIGTTPLSVGTMNPDMPPSVKADVEKLVDDMKTGKFSM
ncbi:MAG: BMP family ABC transporter substrate-binding protein [Alphaproteobacteria bacterium]|nr:BMP family ABC transporter substrate-binding protein [Alphaproteobacteria bacterium]